NLRRRERDALTETPYDDLYGKNWPQGSIHYLDGTAGLLTTFRHMCSTGCGGLYSGHEIVSNVADVDIDNDGRLFHPNEMKHLADYQASLKARALERARVYDEKKKRWAESQFGVGVKS